MNLRSLTDKQLFATTKSLAAAERSLLTKVLWHLAEIQRRKAFSPRYKSLFEYSMKELGYSEDQSARRIAAMRLLVELPEIEPKIANGDLSLTTLGLAQTHFRNESNFQKSHSPAPVNRAKKMETLALLEGKSTRQALRNLIAISSAPEKLRPESIRPVGENLNELKLTVSSEFLEKIARLKGLLAHKHPHLSTPELLDIAMGLALSKLDQANEPTRKTKPALLVAAAPRAKSSTDKNMKSTEARNQTPVSISLRSAGRVARTKLKRSVWRAAGSKCENCGSVHKLEIDHRIPFALGGATSQENLRLLCRNCNQRESFKIFGNRRGQMKTDAKRV